METLKQVRKQTGLTQVQAAKLVGISRRKYQTYEEEGRINKVYDEILNALKEMGITEKGPALLNVRYIKEASKNVFAKYQQVKCAYLFGSYAREEATPLSDVDILIVAPALEGLEFAGLHHDLRMALGKEVDLVNYSTLMKSEKMLRDLLIQGVKIYGQRIDQLKDRRNY